MFCRRCGAHIPEGAASCTRCGAPAVFTPTSGTLPSVGEQFGPPVPGEQFIPPPAWQAPPTGWAYLAGQPGPYAPPPPPRPPLWEQFFGPRPQPGAPPVHQNKVQRLMLNRLPPSIAGSTWYGALMGAMVAVVLALLLSAAVSLTLGPTLDQGSSANALTNLNTSADIGQTGTTSVSLYSNPLMLFASANQSKLIEKITEDLSGDNSSPTSLQATASGTVSATTSPTLLLLIPAIGLIIGGYFAASTNYTGRRLFSITRGASICVIYAALVLIISLFATGSLALSASESGITLSINGTITPDPLSVFLNALLWGVLFGALGGFLRANAFPRTTHSRSYERIRSALIGTGAALGVYFVLCLLLIITLYVTGQLFTPTLLSQSGSTATGNLCTSLSQSLNASTHTTSGSDAARY
ncbi:MAG TPA: zinc ribbon domain-containing protein, partial [Ktedonobacterales bacterium]|nr:zinc ribbon domain-containing protein [Ktedonobacterales bacterium]